MIAEPESKKNIVLIDDDISITQTLGMLLETRGYCVNVANTGKEGFERINQATDLVLLDLVLPDMQGFEVCRKIKENHDTKATPSIILSARGFPEDIVEGLYLGADDYLTKPFEYEELVARIETVMRRNVNFGNGSIIAQGDEAIIYELRKIVDEWLIVSHFQPIFLFGSFDLLGLEVLSRPDTQTMLSNPDVLFKAALQYGFYQDLELMSWRKALDYFSFHFPNEMVFLNCNPYLIEGAEFTTVKRLFDQVHTDTSRVILEITERSAVSDFKLFFEQLRRYRTHGFKFAVDDVGGGYASLESIVETKPEEVKIDRHIISNINVDKYKRSIVKFIVSFCKENNILSIAEGIETQEELDTVIELGVDAGQGFYLCKPSPNITMQDIKKVASQFK